MGIRVMLEAGNDEAESNGSCPGFVEIELGNGDMLIGTAKNENGDMPLRSAIQTVFIGREILLTVRLMPSHLYWQ